MAWNQFLKNIGEVFKNSNSNKVRKPQTLIIRLYLLLYVKIPPKVPDVKIFKATVILFMEVLVVVGAVIEHILGFLLVARSEENFIHAS